MNPINTKISAADTRAVLETQMTQQINQYFDNIAPGIYLRQKTREKRKQLRMMKKRTKLVTLRLGNLRQLDTNQSHSRCSFSNKTKHLLTVSDIKKVAKQDPPVVPQLVANVLKNYRVSFSTSRWKNLGTPMFVLGTTGNTSSYKKVTKKSTRALRWIWTIAEKVAPLSELELDNRIRMLVRKDNSST